MKYIKILSVLLLATCCLSPIYSQHFTAGINSGLNFSDIHGQNTGGKWKSKPGPAESFYLGYSFSNSVGIQTGIGYSNVYYEHISYRSYSPVYYDFNPSSDSFIAPVYNYASDKMDFSFLRIPVLFTINIPSTIQFSMKAGLFFSFLQNEGSSNYYNYTGDLKPAKHDFGYLFSSGISYPLGNNFNATLNISYLTGRKPFLENYNFRHGSSDLSLGIEYKINTKRKNSGLLAKEISDSSSGKVRVTYQGGIGYSWNSFRPGSKKYLPCTGLSLGFSVNIPLGTGVSFMSGVNFERKGYSLKDSSASFYKYRKDSNPVYVVDSRVLIDYAVIPLLFRFNIGESHKGFVSAGIWLGLKLNARNVGTAYNEMRSVSEYRMAKTVIYDDIERSIKDNDTGWLLNMGRTLSVFNGCKLDLIVQYSSGFRDVYKTGVLDDQQGSADPPHSIRNRTISLLIGFTLPQSVHQKK
jgi:hypothetical protein